MEGLSKQPLRVCVCGATQEKATIFLHSLAQGQVLGQNQQLHLVLNDKENRAQELESVAEDLQDCCYPLIKSVQSNCSVSGCLASSDVVLLLLEHGDLRNTLTETQQYAAVLNKSNTTKFKVLIIVGKTATTAAGVLNALCPRLNQQLVVAVDVPQPSSNKYGQHGGAYQMAKMVSDTVRAWATAEQAHTTLGVSFHHLKDTPPCCALPVPVTVLAPFTAEVDVTSASYDEQRIKGATKEFETAVHLLRLSDADLVASALSSKM